MILLAALVVSVLAIDYATHLKWWWSPMTPKGIFADGVVWSLFYIAIACAYGFALRATQGFAEANLYWSGYLTEKALSVDNLMAFGLVFNYFGIKDYASQRQALYLGVWGAAVSRVVFTVLGVGGTWLLGGWMELAMGGIVGMTAIKMLLAAFKTSPDEAPPPVSASWFWPLVKRLPQFWVCVAAMELTDLTFSFDSIPAVIGVAKHASTIYASMIFAILGLRSLYFVLDGLQRYLIHLNKAVLAVLTLISGKLIVHAITGFEPSSKTTLLLVGGLLTAGVVASLLFPEKAKPQEVSVP